MEQSLYEWLERIEARPGMYLPAPGFATLTAFISGFEIALISRHIGSYAAPDFSLFGEFVAQRLEHRSSDEENSETPTWEHCILAKTKDDQEAFALFFALLREFRTHGAPESGSAPSS
jgi:hypothetical protein